MRLDLFLFVWLPCSIFLVPALAATLPHPNAPEIALPVNRNGSIAGLQAPQYTIVPIFEGQNLDQIPLLMSAVQLMAKEAVENINDDVERITWKSPDPRFTGIGILVLPGSHSDTIPRRIVNWGLTQSLLYLMNHNRYESVRVMLNQDGGNIGSISFTKMGNSGRVSRERLSDSPLLSSGPTVINSTDPLNHTLITTSEGLQVYIRQIGYDLEPTDVFAPVVNMLDHFAQYPPNAYVVEWRTPAESGQTALAFIRSRRGYPPFFQKEQLIKATAVTPLFMINKGRFSEADIKVQVIEGKGGVVVGNGELRIQRTPPPHVLANVTVS